MWSEREDVLNFAKSEYAKFSREYYQNKDPKVRVTREYLTKILLEFYIETNRYYTSKDIKFERK